MIIFQSFVQMIKTFTSWVAIYHFRQEKSLYRYQYFSRKYKKTLLALTKCTMHGWVTLQLDGGDEPVANLITILQS